MSVLLKMRNELIALNNSSETKKGQQVEICSSRRKTATGFYGSSFLFIEVASYFRVLYCQQYLQTRAIARKNKEKIG